MRLADPQRWRLPGVVVLLLSLLALGFVASTFWVFLLTSMITTALVARSIGIVFGRAGMVSLCQASFAGIGGWMVGSATLHWSVPFEVALVLAGLAVVPVGVVVGLPALRLRGVNLAVVTLGFAVAMAVLLFNRGFPGSGTNFAVPRPRLFASDRGYYVFAVLVAALIEVGLRWIDRRRFGAGWKAVGHSERTTAALGLSVPFTKLTAFGASAFVAGVAGALSAGQVGVLSGRSFQEIASLTLFALAVLAGSQFLLGALLAGVLFVGIPELLRTFGWSLDWAPILFAAGAVQALSQGSGGIASQWHAVLVARRRGGDARVPVPMPMPVATGDGAAARNRWTHAPRPLTLRRLDVRFGSVIAVDGVDLMVEPGKVHGLIGPNGAGKTSLIDAVTGFVPASGAVLLGGTDLGSLPAHRRARAGLRRTFQRERTIPDLTIAAYLTLAGAREMASDEAAWLLSALSLPDTSTVTLNLDAGARRRLEIAGAAAGRPEVLLLDEPAAGLTDEESRALAQAISSLANEWGIGILLVEHDIDLVRSICGKVSVLDQGRLLASGAPDVILHDPRVMAAYLGTVPEGLVS